MISKCKWQIDDNINEKWFIDNCEYFKYYGRDIEVLLSKCKIAHSKRMFGKKKIDCDIKKSLEILLETAIKSGLNFTKSSDKL